MLTTTSDVANITQGQGITKCYPSGVRSILRHWTSCFRDSPPVQQHFAVVSCPHPHPGDVFHQGRASQDDVPKPHRMQ